MEALLVSVTETRRLLGGISRTTFYELIKAGYLKPVKIGRRTLPSHRQHPCIPESLRRVRCQSHFRPRRSRASTSRSFRFSPASLLRAGNSPIRPPASTAKSAPPQS
jgi:hypothetical protein